MTSERVDAVSESPYVLPMFPLEQVILPSMVVPLHIFEARYRKFAHDLQTMAEPSFGIVGIERGREVGGDDQRFEVGVVMRVLSAEEFADGRWALNSVASRRLTVDEWLPDDPYPRAAVRDRHDDVGGDHHDAGTANDRDSLVAEFERLAETVRRRYPQVDLLANLGPTDDIDWRTWELVSRCGLGALDHVALLRCDVAAQRTRLATELIADHRALLDALAEGDR